ncbi:hypothetical protein Tco_0923562 [Tanacetum coccineum]|uniref:Reverse transcriptase domain-containing protein n=1 Tax=Tanacetum coccineum TaxID=301880 RepID=A0ABQ5D2D5_9ASTR
MEEDYEPSVQSQRRVNPKIHDVIKKEVEKLLDAGLIYRDSLSALGKLNEATRKDHFPLPFMDQMLERLAGNEYYCFLDGFSGYFQIPIDPKGIRKDNLHMPHTEGIVLGHKISKSGLEVDRAKVEVIAKLPHPTSVKGDKTLWFLGIDALDILKACHSGTLWADTMVPIYTARKVFDFWFLLAHHLQGCPWSLYTVVTFVTFGKIYANGNVMTQNSSKFAKSLNIWGIDYYGVRSRLHEEQSTYLV